MTKIIGHRGALGLALQNSIEGVRAALALGLDGIEIDLRITKDGKIVLLHDKHTRRVARRWVRPRDLTLEELRTVRLHNGEHIPTLEEVFEVVGDKVPLMLDIKDPGITDELLRLLELFPKVEVIFSGRQYDDLKRLHAARPEVPFLLQHHHDPIEIIHHAHNMSANGICLNMWLMNPWTYKLAQEHHMQIYVYTINHRWILRFFERLYPEVVVVSNHPERLIDRGKLSRTNQSEATTSSTSTTPSQ